MILAMLLPFANLLVPTAVPNAVDRLIAHLTEAGNGCQDSRRSWRGAPPDMSRDPSYLVTRSLGDLITRIKRPQAPDGGLVDISLLTTHDQYCGGTATTPKEA